MALFIVKVAEPYPNPTSHVNKNTQNNKLSFYMCEGLLPGAYIVIFIMCCIVQ